MLAGALASTHLGIPVVHVHGGERTGTVDEPIRHAISKLAHLHLVSTAGARERLLRMGERPEHVIVTGAPGLDGLRETAKTARAELCREQGFDAARPVALVIFHPVLQEAASAGRQLAGILDGALGERLQLLCFGPNSDAGAAAVRQELASRSSHPDVRVVEHFARERFVSWMAAADVMLGNSSAGIIEAASLGLPVVNVGSRQKARERSANVIDVEQALHLEVGRATARALAGGRSSAANVYGDGKSAGRIVEILATFPFDGSILQKTNAY
jgi:GDP/UDP-N,N'-diacetylbacillosamine 2-epimerase (hydrolysing)